MGAPDPPAPPAPVENAEIEAVRATARWLVGVSGAVLATLLVGVQFSQIGRLKEYPVELAVAVGAAMLALAAVAAVLVGAVRVLVDSGWTLFVLASLADKSRWRRHWLRDQLGGQRGELGLGTDQLDLPALYRKFSILRQAWSTYASSGEVSVPENLDVRGSPTVTYTSANVEGLQRRVTHHEQIAARVAAVASLLTVRRRFRHLNILLMVVAPVPILAVGAFAWATAIPNETAITAPVAVVVELRGDPVAVPALDDQQLPAACRARPLHAIAVGGTLSQPVVVRAAKPDCPLPRIEITPDLGVAYPVVTAPR